MINREPVDEHLDSQEEDIFFDYEVLNKCEFPEPANVPDGAIECFEPGTHKVWWQGKTDEMIVCQKHFDFIDRNEKPKRQNSDEIPF